MLMSTFLFLLLKILSQIDKMKIYKDKVNNIQINLKQIKEFSTSYQYLKVQVYEYDRFYYFGASAIDLCNENEFIHNISSKRKGDI